jgi:hypothetical protein
VPDWVIRAQFGHVSPSMMAVYSHVRRKALDEAAQALEPETQAPVPPTPETPETVSRGGVTSHVTSQQPPPRSNVIDFPKEIGAPCMTRTCDLLVRRLMQVVYPVGSSMVSLTLDRRFYPVLGSELFIDCSLFWFWSAPPLFTDRSGFRADRISGDHTRRCGHTPICGSRTHVQRTPTSEQQIRIT